MSEYEQRAAAWLSFFKQMGELRRSLGFEKYCNTSKRISNNVMYEVEENVFELTPQNGRVKVTV